MGVCVHGSWAEYLNLRLAVTPKHRTLAEEVTERDRPISEPIVALKLRVLFACMRYYENFLFARQLQRYRNPVELRMLTNPFWFPDLYLRQEESIFTR